MLFRLKSIPSLRPCVWSGRLSFLAMLGLAAMLLYRISLPVADLDLWHEMALARETVKERAVPWADSFAYTPTVYPVVHHEWGAGMLAYIFSSTLGKAGILALKYLLALGLAVVCWRCARRRGAHLAVLSFLAPVAILLADHGFSTVRAQMYSFLFAACLLYWFDRDREGKRGWLALWLALYVCWLNVHAGFLVGAGLFALHWVEQVVRRQPHRHLLPVGLAMIALIALNPYGVHYYHYLWRAVTMPRPLVEEWTSLWASGRTVSIVLFTVSLAVAACALCHRQARQAPGLAIVAVTGAYAMLHQRMLPFYAIAWLCYLPAAIEPTALGQAMRQVWRRRQPALAAVWAMIAVLLLARAVAFEPWNLRVPATALAAGQGHPIYPVGAVEYLENNSFRGNVMTPYDYGAYLSWKLYPKVRVSMDSRYEVAYPPGAGEENYAFYLAQDGWANTLRRYPTDAVLTPRWSPLDRLLDSSTGDKGGPDLAWRRVYHDDHFALFFSRPPDTLPIVDRTGERIRGPFP